MTAPGSAQELSRKVGTAHDRWLAWSADRFGILLVILVIDYATLMMLDDGILGTLIGVLTVSVTVLFAVDVAHVKRRVRIIVRSFVLLIPLSLAVYLIVPTLTRGIVYIAFGVVLAATPVLVLMRILGHEKVDMATLLAALDVYILIGLVFALLYFGASHFDTSHPFFAQRGPKDRSDYVYFSYVVLTTVGFGDLTPLSKLARTLVVTEALVGQIFLVTTVARVVALFGGTQALRLNAKQPKETQEDHNP